MYFPLFSSQNKMKCIFVPYIPLHYCSSFKIQKVYFLFFFFLCSGDADGELIARLCGQAAPSVPLVIAASQIWVHFVSDGNTEDKGFLAHYMFEGKWLDRVLPMLTEALLGNVAIHLVILRIHTMGSTLEEVLKSYTVPAIIYIHLKQTYASN